jgi:cell wall-associated NlpC family hydrolase
MLVFSGLENQTLTSILHSVASGQKPAKGAAVSYATPASTTGSSASGPLPQSDSAIANAAEKRIGQNPYVFGGAPGPDGTGPVDCSSFASLVLGHDLNIPIPGGSWAEVTNNGSTHGPSTVSYLSWSGAETIGHNADVAQPGDLCVWQTHMGICVGPNQMVSAQDPAKGTGLSEINGAIPEFLFIRRVILGNSRG